MSTTSSASCRASATNQQRSGRGLVPVPASIAWLEHAQLSMTAQSADLGANFGRTARYELMVSFRPDKLLEASSWTLHRSFEDMQAFQKRLLKKMRRGHVCGAECAWLFKVVKHYFPKASLLCNNCPKIVETRRQTLLKCLTTVQASLLNRGNHGCNVLMGDVADEFNRFLHASLKDAELSTTDSSSSEISSEAPMDDDLDDDDDSSDDDEPAMFCDVCKEVHAGGADAHFDDHFDAHD